MEFENVTEHPVCVDPYVDEHYMEVNHVKHDCRFRAPWNETSSLEVSTVQGVINGSELHLLVDHFLQHLHILSPYHTPYEMVRVALNGMYPYLKMPCD